MDPESFWRQTPRSYVAIMEGASRRLKREYDAQVALAWHMAAFNATTKGKKGLKPLAHYLGQPAKKKAQAPSEMLEVFRELQSRGAPMTITRTN